MRSEIKLLVVRIKSSNYVCACILISKTCPPALGSLGGRALRAYEHILLDQTLLFRAISPSTFPPGWLGANAFAQSTVLTHTSSNLMLDFLYSTQRRILILINGICGYLCETYAKSRIQENHPMYVNLMDAYNCITIYML